MYGVVASVLYQPDSGQHTPLSFFIVLIDFTAIFIQLDLKIHNVFLPTH